MGMRIHVGIDAYGDISFSILRPGKVIDDVFDKEMA